jgi:DNA-binding PadR family transcriptional regulator
MQPEDIEKAIILAAYTAYFAGESSVGMHDIRTALGADEQVFEQVADSLKDRSLVVPHASSWHNKISPYGILFAEDNGIVQNDIADVNRQTRTKILDYLAQAHEAERYHHGRFYEQIATDLGLDLSVVRPNLLLLTDYRFIQAPGGGVFRISDKGIEAVVEWRRKKAIIQEFDDLSNMKPQARGRTFQKLLARQLGEEGWYQEEGARTSNEEIDIILHKDNSYYLIECKWEKKPIETKVIRDLFGKLSHRTEVKGIVVSMSGFAAGALAAAHDFRGQATILLFGPEDVRSIFRFESTFSALLENKLREAVIRRKVVFR